MAQAHGTTGRPWRRPTSLDTLDSSTFPLTLRAGGAAEFDRLAQMSDVAPEIAHDIRNLLNVIVVGSKMTLRHTNEDGARWLEAVGSAARRSGRRTASRSGRGRPAS